MTSAAVVRQDGTVEGLGTVGTIPAIPTAGVGDQVELHYDYSADLFPAPEVAGGGMWRYSALLPLEPGPVRYPLPVGGTPLVGPPALRTRLGMPRLWVKDETRGPTGSNKDRASALVVEHALRTGARTVTCASTGNVATSLAVAAAAAGLEAVVFVPATVLDSKLTVMLTAGARVVKVERGYEAAFALSRRAAAQLGWLDRNTGVNPMTVEAKKTVAFEIWEQLGRAVPDVVMVPVGDGPTLCAMAKGFRELIACGLADRLPRLVGVQAEGCQPVKAAWEAGRPVSPVVASTIADGIAVGAPVSAGAVLRDVRESRGSFVAVSDQALLDAISSLARHAGLIAEPAGAAAFAGLEEALRQGLVGREESVVVHMTGTGLKAPIYLRPALEPILVEGDLDELAAAFGGLS